MVLINFSRIFYWPIIIFILCGGCHVDTYDKKETARLQIEILCAGLEDYKQDVGHYPDTEEGLDALINNPKAAVGWQGPYLSKNIPKDPWNREYRYIRNEEKNV